MSRIQAVLFEKKQWTRKKAQEWLKKHELKPVKPAHITKNLYRYRIEDPRYFDHFVIKKTGKGIELVIGFEAPYLGA